MDDAHKKILWRCRRGMLELDLYLMPFAKQDYLSLSQAERQIFIHLLTLPDPEILSYLTGDAVADAHVQPIVEKIRDAKRKLV